MTVTGLQRSAGNAAVSRAMMQASDPTIAQRSSISAVLAAPGRPLEASLRADMEARLGADFSAVRLHTGTSAARSAAEIGALAFTSGEHVVLGSGGGDPHTLAHELTHVIQQRHNPVAGKDGGFGLSISDPGDRFEKAAEANAHRVMSQRPVAAATGPVAAGLSGAATAGGLSAVQRLVVVGMGPGRRVYSDTPANGNKGQAGKVLTDGELIVAIHVAIHGSGDQELIDQYETTRPQVHQQVTKWWSDTEVGKNTSMRSHPMFGRKRQERFYDNDLEVGRALVGWVAQKPGRHQEKEFAQDLQTDQQLAIDLDAVLSKLNTWIHNLPDGMVRPHQAAGFGQPALTLDRPLMLGELATGRGVAAGAGSDSWGTYQSHLDAHQSITTKTSFAGNFLSVLNGPSQFPVREKMIVLHDLYDYFKPYNPDRRGPRTAGNGLLPNEPGGPAGLLTLSSQAMTRDGRRQVTENDRDKGAARTVRNEDAPSTRMAREHRIPVAAGQSTTTARLLSLAELSGASVDELNSVALGIFSFWRLDYDHTVALAAHTLHEVMDIATNFGVQYNMKTPQQVTARYAQVHESRTRRDRLASRVRLTNDKLASQARPLQTAVAAMTEEINARIIGRFRHQDRLIEADALLRNFTGNVRRASKLADLAEFARTYGEVEMWNTYARTLRSALDDYHRLCELLKVKRIENILARNDSEGVRWHAAAADESDRARTA